MSADALSTSGQVFLAGSGLPGRWAGRRRFVILDTGFGLGHAFLATWAAWQQDARRCDRLWYLGITPQPPSRDALAHAHAGSPLPALAGELIRRWPVLTPDLHLIDVDGGQVRLLLALGEVNTVLRELVASVDAFYLGAGDGSAPSAQHTMPAGPAPAWGRHRLRQLTRLAAPGATLVAGNASAALHQALRTAGFQLDLVAGAPATALGRPPGTLAEPSGNGGNGGNGRGCDSLNEPGGQTTTGHFAPRVGSITPPGRRAGAGIRRVAVVGAGLAGAAVAQALAARGLAVQVIDRQAGPAGETSGNAGGLFHGIAHPADGPHARWLRAAALHTERVLRPLIEAGTLPGAIGGLLRGERALSAEAMQALIDQLALPADYLRVQREGLPAGLAARPGASRPAAAWAYPGGGWVSPAALCALWLAAPGITGHFGAAVHQLQPAGSGWRLLGESGRRLLDAGGQPLADADAVVLCNAGDAVRLLAPLPTGAAWPLRSVRGQTTLLPAAIGRSTGLPDLPQPLADTGYALQLPDGGWLCGATAQPDDPHPALRDADHQHNLATLRRLTGWAGEVALDQLGGRVGWRLQSADRLPLLGPVPAGAADRSADSTDGGEAGDGAFSCGLTAPATAAPRQRRPDQPRQVPRHLGLYVFTALGSRGITQAALGAEVLASWLTGDPHPLPASLLDALDVARFVSRAVRRPPLAT